MVLVENKVDVLSVLLMAKSLMLHEDLELVTSGGFEKALVIHRTDVKCPTCHPIIKRQTLRCGYTGFFATNPVFGVSEQVMFKPASSATETS